jgi:hypothetical protein
VAGATVSKQHTGRRFMRWLLEERTEEVKGLEAGEGEEHHAWWQVVCLTGVDYFSTLVYIPGIAVATAGALSPVATLLIVLLLLFGMLPMYRVVTAESPHGQGSIAMLQRLISFWKGKLFVLYLLSFVATSWVITITLSASDSTAHVVENPFWPEAPRDERILVTLALLAVLGGISLKGFREAIGIAVAVVGAYLLVNLAFVAAGFYEIAARPQALAGWQRPSLARMEARLA